MDLDTVVRYFETLTPQSLARLGDHYSEDAYFRDPFNEVRGIAEVRAIFERMFESLHDPRFVVVNRIAQGDQAMLEWDFHFRIRRYRPREPWVIHGTSHVRLAPDGRVRYHRDYWDAGAELYARLPVLGPVVRWVARRMA